MSCREKPFGPSLPVGIPRELQTRINYLANLKNLASSLPLGPAEPPYNFDLDIEEEGGIYAFNCALEVVFQTHELRRDATSARYHFTATWVLPVEQNPVEEFCHSAGHTTSSTVTARVDGSLKAGGDNKNIQAPDFST
ncbi:hypothetical protein DFH07DRAFT_777326 [Mycena maculata]|uniref:Uncharacterized protein n=1 Tax=Mycena maculata TaxID=230809 RepID=A0AAD7IK80_9AGAR|nr:hypothetical protein DFH07DRAFT_777326 [Mycena maculata]